MRGRVSFASVPVADLAAHGTRDRERPSFDGGEPFGGHTDVAFVDADIAVIVIEGMQF